MQTNDPALIQAKKKIRLLTTLIVILVPLVLVFGYFWLSTPKNVFASFSKEKKEKYLKAILGGAIAIPKAQNQHTDFTTKRNAGQLTIDNMPEAVCFTSKEIVAFLNSTYNYQLDVASIPDDNKGVAFIYGMSANPDYRNGKGTIMVVSTNYTEYTTTPNIGRVDLDNQVLKVGSTFVTKAYDIGSIYP